MGCNALSLECEYIGVQDLGQEAFPRYFIYYQIYSNNIGSVWMLILGTLTLNWVKYQIRLVLVLSYNTKGLVWMK